jgi:hypothetical protein
MKAIKRVISRLKYRFGIKRTEKELIELMLDNQDLFVTGLCKWVQEIYFYKLITFNEYRVLLSTFIDNSPNTEIGIGFYWWDSCNIEPRIDFLNNLLEKYK